MTVEKVRLGLLMVFNCEYMVILSDYVKHMLKPTTLFSSSDQLRTSRPSLSKVRDQLLQELP